MRTFLAALLAALVLVATLAPGRAPAHESNALLLDYPQVRVKALDFEARLTTGKTIRLSALAGQVVFLNFWATWCVPCLKEMPAMSRLYRKLAGPRFVMLAVNMQESPEQVAAYVKQHPVEFPIVMDVDGTIARDYGVNNIPLTYIINTEGEVMARALGPREWDSKAGLHFFEHLTAEAPKSAKPAAAR